MVQFRKAILVLAVLVLVAGFANAQSSCSVSTTPVNARSEGFAEPLGDVLLTCTLTGPAPGVGNKINVVLRLGTEVTSITTSGVLESKLLVNGTTSYQGVRTGDFEITFNGIPFETGTDSLRIINVRGNASRVGGGALNAILAAVTVSAGSPGAILPLVPQQGSFLPVAFVSDSLLFTAESTGTIPSGSTAATYTVSRSQCAFNTVNVNLKWAERTANAFRPVLGENFTPPGTGVATNGTWLRARLTNLPAGATVTAPVAIASSAATPGTARRLTNSGAVASDGTVAAPAAASDNKVTVAADGSAEILYEVTGSDPSNAEIFTAGITVDLPSSSVPPLGDFGTAMGGYAPYDGTATPATSKASAPRFTTTLQSRSTPLFTIITCQTRLLFPFVTYDGQFETGIAISNTSKDPYNTKTQAGKCQLYFYGQGASDGTNQTTSVDIASGKQLLFTLSLGNPAAGVNPIGKFTGYMIAQCNFQFAHGYAFISDVGATQLAQGYLALVIDGSLRGSSTTSESLNN